MIAELIIFVGVTVLWSCGLYLVTEKGMVGYPIRKFAVMRFPEWIHNPIIVCITCMASFHGTLIFILLILEHIIHLNLVVWILGCVMSAFIQTFLMSIYLLVKRWTLP